LKEITFLILVRFPRVKEESEKKREKKEGREGGGIGEDEQSFCNFNR